MRLHRHLLTIIALWVLPLSILFGEEFSVKFEVIRVGQPSDKHRLEVGLWRPVDRKTEQSGQPNIPIKGLIIISHGFSGNFQGHRDTAEALANGGYLVAAPTHADLNGLRLGRPDSDPLLARPKQIEQIIRFLINDPSFKRYSLKDNIGIVGFSLGAYTALVSAGAKPDFLSLTDYCQIQPGDGLLCSVQSRQRLSSLALYEANPKSYEIKGAVLLAPAYGPLFDKNSLAEVKIPIKMYSAEKDRELDERFNIKHFARVLPKRPELEVVKDAGHFVFMAPCNDSLKKAVPYICIDAPSVDRAEIHQNMNKEIIQFFHQVFQ
jgi:predicted dienelactone hydrolase